MKLINYIFFVIVIVLTIFTKSTFSNKEFIGQYNDYNNDPQQQNATIIGIVGSTVERFSQLVTGVLNGLGVTITDENTVCFKKNQYSLDNFDNGILLISNSIKNFSVIGITTGMTDVGLSLLEIPIVLNECKITKHVSEITFIALELVSGPQGILKLFLTESLSIFLNGGNLLQDWWGVFNSFKSGDYYNLGKYIGDIISILLKSN